MNQARMVAGLLSLAMAGLCSGCSYSSGRGWQFHPVETLVDGLFDSALERKSETDKLWEQGYGYNNPNASRRP